MAIKGMRDRRPHHLKLQTQAQQSLSFTIMNGNVRQECVLRTTYLNPALAMRYLTSNRAKIEKIARERWEDGIIEDGIVYVDMD
jgi:hypothetical protein